MLTLCSMLTRRRRHAAQGPRHLAPLGHRQRQRPALAAAQDHAEVRCAVAWHGTCGVTASRCVSLPPPPPPPLPLLMPGRLQPQLSQGLRAAARGRPTGLLHLHLQPCGGRGGGGRGALSACLRSTAAVVCVLCCLVCKPCCPGRTGLAGLCTNSDVLPPAQANTRLCVVDLTRGFNPFSPGVSILCANPSPRRCCAAPRGRLSWLTCRTTCPCCAACRASSGGGSRTGRTGTTAGRRGRR